MTDKIIARDRIEHLIDHTVERIVVFRRAIVEAITDSPSSDAACLRAAIQGLSEELDRETRLLVTLATAGDDLTALIVRDQAQPDLQAAA